MFLYYWLERKLINLWMEQCRQLTFVKENWWTASSLSEEAQPRKIDFASLSHPLVCLHLSNYLKINTYRARNDQFISLICMEIQVKDNNQRLRKYLIFIILPWNLKVKITSSNILWFYLKTARAMAKSSSPG